MLSTPNNLIHVKFPNFAIDFVFWACVSLTSFLCDEIYERKSQCPEKIREGTSRNMNLEEGLTELEMKLNERERNKKGTWERKGGLVSNLRRLQMNTTLPLPKWASSRAALYANWNSKEVFPLQLKQKQRNTKKKSLRLKG